MQTSASPALVSPRVWVSGSSLPQGHLIPAQASLFLCRARLSSQHLAPLTAVGCLDLSPVLHAMPARGKSATKQPKDQR